MRGGILSTSTFVLVAFLLLADDPPGRLVSGQFEAVGAVLSVVPVTSILATAGLVGVKLAALSRILQALGYDRAYLAQGGPGTAAQPIGLHTNYAYMFPYAPGLNISVKAEHGPYGGGGQQQTPTVASNRKIYPAMGLPGDYEKQPRPFRGSETLKKIFQQAGIQLHLPTQQQQQQLQQQFQVAQQQQQQGNNQFGPPSSQGVTRAPPAPAPAQQQLNEPQQNTDINYNDRSTNQQQQQPPLSPEPLDVHAIPLALQPHLQLESRPSSAQLNQMQHHQHPTGGAPMSTTMRFDPPTPSPPLDVHQISPLSSSSYLHQQAQQAQQQPTSSTSTTSSSSNNNNDRLSQASSTAQVSQPQLFSERFADSADRETKAHRHNKLVAFFNHHHIPQREFYTRPGGLEGPHQWASPSSQLANQPPVTSPQPPATDPLPTGQLSPMFVETPALSVNPLATLPFRFPSTGAAPRPELPNGMVLNSLRSPEQRHQQGQHHHHHQLRPQFQLQAPTRPTPASQPDGFSPDPNEITTNMLPPVSDDLQSPSSASHDDRNEMERFDQHPRRKRRSLSAGSWTTGAGQPGPSSPPGGPMDGQLTAREQNEQPQARQTFGMPAVNIHSVRRRRGRRAFLSA